jgi:hypothetical protein
MSLPPFLSAVPNPLIFTITVPPLEGGVGTITVNLPDHTLQWYAIGLSLAGIASSLVTMALATQTITSVTGGIKIKDALDPYQYTVITQALEANGQPIPPGAAPTDIVPNPLGGAIAGAGALSGVAAAAALATGVVPIALPFAVSAGTGIVQGGGAAPDISGAMTLISASLAVIGTCLTVMANSLNSSVDVPSQALVIKKVMSTFNASLNTQSIAIAGRVPPIPPVF